MLFDGQIGYSSSDKGRLKVINSNLQLGSFVLRRCVMLCVVLCCVVLCCVVLCCVALCCVVVCNGNNGNLFMRRKVQKGKKDGNSLV